MWLFIAYLLLNFLVAAFFLDKILIKVYPQENVIDSFNSFLLYYFLLDLLARFHLQELPTLTVKPYLHLRVRKNQIVNYLSISSMSTSFNSWPIILMLPFLIKVVLPERGDGAFWGMIVAITGFTLFNHFFTLWLKRKVNMNALWMLAFWVILLLLTSLDFYFHVFSIRELSTGIFNRVINQPAVASFAILLSAAIYYVNHRYLKNNFYLDEFQTWDGGKRSGIDIPFLNRFGSIGDLAANELKLILRNKRSKTVLVVSAFFLFYGLIFYGKEATSGYSWTIFCGIFITGIFIINYGQLMFSWQSAHFDGLLVHKVSIKDFFESKLLLFTLFSTACFILTIPYVYFGWNVLIIHFIMYLWNLGINTILVLYFANRNYKRMDLTKGGAFNMEGFGATQWILSIPLMAGPYIIFVPAQLMGYPKTGVALIGIISVSFILTREFWVRKLVEDFQSKRYKIADGFRNK